MEHYAGYVEYTIRDWLKVHLPAASVELLKSSVSNLIGQIRVKWLKFSPFLLSQSIEIVSVLQNYVHLSCQKPPESCFENSSWTHYDVTFDYVRTHSILTFFAFFKFLSLFHLAVLGSVSSSLVAVSFIGIMSCHHCPIITLFQLHAFQFSSFQFG